ncbi:MAG: ribosome recycling factor, partial [Opitutae bacterium]
MQTDEIFENMSSAMTKAVDHVLNEFNSLHTGKASPGMVEHIVVKVESYGSSMPVRDIAAVTTPDSRTIVIQPWDKGVLK